MKATSARALLLLLFFSPLVAAVNFTQCLDDFRQNSSAIGGVDSQGRPVSPAAAVGLTYQTCAARCGTGSESFNWRTFAQLFAAWLLPWLALLSQLPFGSAEYVDDFVSIVMSLGSPALAAYSLFLTSLNARLVYHRMETSEYNHRRSGADALISIQQIPLKLTNDQYLLHFIQFNNERFIQSVDEWTKELKDKLVERNVRSLATEASIAWVIIAFFFTLIDSFVSIDDALDVITEGHAIGTIWLWLLCLVIGWYWVPTFDSSDIKSALRFANEKAITALNSDNKKTEGVTSHHASALPLQPHSKSQQRYDHITIAVHPNENQSTVNVTHSTQPPIGPETGNPSFDPKTDKLLIPLKRNLLNRDELRLTATFNYSRFVRYLSFADGVLKALDESAHEESAARIAERKKKISAARTAEKEEKKISAAGTAEKEKVMFPKGTFPSMFKAAIMALILQGGTTAAAVIIVYYTPPPGFECRSLGYIIYGAVATIVMFLSIISTIFARMSETWEEALERAAWKKEALEREAREKEAREKEAQEKEKAQEKEEIVEKEETRGKKKIIFPKSAASIAIALRWISLSLAAINGTGLIVLSCFQFSNFLDTCYCNAGAVGLGADSYVLIVYSSSTSVIRNSRIAATLLSAIVMTIYMVFLRLVTTPPQGVVNDADGV